MNAAKTGRLLFAALMTVALQSGAAPASPAPRPTLAPGSYVSGGIGEEGQANMHLTRDAYNLRLTFAEVGRGAYVADVTVMIEPIGPGVRYGPVIDCGPFFHVIVRPGAYRVNASHAGLTVIKTLQVGKGATLSTFYWPVEAPGGNQ